MVIVPAIYTQHDLSRSVLMELSETFKQAATTKLATIVKVRLGRFHNSSAAEISDFLTCS